MRINLFLKATSHAALLFLVCGVATAASAQTTYYQGTAILGDPVSVDMSVLDNLGTAANLPELLNPGMLIPPAAKATTPPTPQSVVPLSIDSASAPVSGLEGAPPIAMKVESAPTPMRVEPTQTAPAPSQAPASGLVGAAIAAPIVAQNDAMEKSDSEMADAIAASTAEEEAKAAEAEAMKVAEEEAKAAEAEAMKVAEEEAKAAEAEAMKVAEKEAKAAEAAAMKVAEEEAKAAEESAKAAEAIAAAAVLKVAEEATKTEEAESIQATEEKVELLAAAPDTEAVVPEKESTPAEAQTASIDPDAVKIGKDGTFSIKFAEGSSDLPNGIEPALNELAKKLTEDDDLRVQLWGYAAVTGDSPSQARRLSLFRALSVRTYLMKQGVRSTRMDVRALGDKVEDGYSDRVDVVFPNKS